MKTDLTGKVAFVFGSTKGIGKAIALKLAKNGSDIVLNGRGPDAPATLIKEIQNLQRKVIYERANISNYAEVKNAIDQALGKLGTIDILVASGGIIGVDYIPKFFHQSDPSSYLLFADNQWLSRLNCVRAVLDHMIEKRGGKIIIITSDAGRWPTPTEVLSGGSCAAVIMGTKVMAQEVGRYGIRINALSLPPIPDTEAYNHTTGLSESLGHVFEKAMAKQSFPVTAADIAEAALFFSADESNAITGQILSINGGLCFPG